ncbi:MAG: hypothetical protein WBG92_17300 [Thiohalocapsa sp.]
MREWAIAAALVYSAVAGCASGPRGPLPLIKQPGEAVSVTLERKSSIVGFPATMFFTIEDQQVYGLLNGQRWSFQIDPGEHRFGYELGFNTCRERVILRPNQRYLVELTPICEINPRAL